MIRYNVRITYTFVSSVVCFLCSYHPSLLTIILRINSSIRYHPSFLSWLAIILRSYHDSLSSFHTFHTLVSPHHQHFLSSFVLSSILYHPSIRSIRSYLRITNTSYHPSTIILRLSSFDSSFRWILIFWFLDSWSRNRLQTHEILLLGDSSIWITVE